MKHAVFSICLAASLASMPLTAAELNTDKQKFSYALGGQIGNNVKQQGVEVDTDAFVEGMRDVLNDAEMQLTPEQMQQAAQSYQKTLQAERDAKGGDNAKVGNEFRARNKTAEGVKETASGIQYKVLETGSGKQPSPESLVTVHYRGTLINGEEFDSSYSRGEPASFQVDQVIKGWQEILPMMKEGGKWQIVIPPDLAYGDRGAGASIGPNETLVFDVELIKVES